MNRHEGVSCDSCLKNNFRGRRYKCLICVDYDLCATCYESGATTNQHSTDHSMQCILSRSDFELTVPWETNIPKDHTIKSNKYYDLTNEITRNGFKTQLYAVEVGARGIPAKSLHRLLKDLGLPRSAIGTFMDRVSKMALTGSYSIWLSREGSELSADLYYGGEALSLEQPCAYTCPFCNRMGFTDSALMDHVTVEHSESNMAVVCPVCASMPGGEPNFVTDDFAGHLTLEHRTGPRDLITFLDEPSGIRHGGVRRMPHNRGVNRARRSNMQFTTGGGLSSLSPSSRDAVVDPIAELLSQLSGVRRATGQPSTPSQLQQLQMQLQLERQQATVARQQLERLPRRPPATAAAPAAATPAPAPAPHTQPDSGEFLLAWVGSETQPPNPEAANRAALLRGLLLAALGKPTPVHTPAPTPRPPPAKRTPAPSLPPPRAKPVPRKEPAPRQTNPQRHMPEGR